MKLLAKSIIVSIVTTISTMTILQPTTQTTEPLHSHNIQVPVVISLELDENGNLINSEIITIPNPMNIIDAKNNQLPEQEEQVEHQKAPITDKEHMLQGLVTSLYGIGNGVYGVTIFIFFAGKLIVTKTGAAAWRLFNRINFKNFGKKQLPVL